MQTFGLLFQDKFKALNMSATDISVIINLNSAFGMGLGLINGPLLRYYGFRKVAFAAGIFFSIGMFCTAFANSFGTFAFSYGIIACKFNFSFEFVIFFLFFLLKFQLQDLDYQLHHFP